MVVSVVTVITPSISGRTQRHRRLSPRSRIARKDHREPEHGLLHIESLRRFPPPRARKTRRITGISAAHAARSKVRQPCALSHVPSSSTPAPNSATAAAPVTACPVVCTRAAAARTDTQAWRHSSAQRSWQRVFPAYASWLTLSFSSVFRAAVRAYQRRSQADAQRDHHDQRMVWAAMEAPAAISPVASALIAR